MTLADRQEIRQPPYHRRQGLARLQAEALDHLWPWRSGSTQHRGFQRISLTLAALASLAWALAAFGLLPPDAIIGSWFGWSLLEIAIRYAHKPYVKEGPWWGHLYRRASLMDLVCYVGFKNLLIGAVLFLALRGVGAVVV
ncbi:MAG: transcription regulator [Zoogloea sp.]|uniref:transcription regulator n=1 Tax=Zoogloea sp. TaxID=49181 RepID=UPI003F3A19A4